MAGVTTLGGPVPGDTAPPAGVEGLGFEPVVEGDWQPVWAGLVRPMPWLRSHS
jgi:hypothetical protein